MATNVLVVYYSTYGHTFRMAQAVAEGAGSVHGAEVRLRCVVEFEAARQAMSGQDTYRRRDPTGGLGGRAHGRGR